MRVAALGKQGAVTGAAQDAGRHDARGAAGSRARASTALREAVTEAIAATQGGAGSGGARARLATERLDLTLPVEAGAQGSVHPVSQVMDELAEIFADLGFAVATGPEIEDDWHNFTALNIPESHPARAMHDTFYFDADGRWTATAARDACCAPTPRRCRSARCMSAGSRRSASSRRAASYRSDSDATHTPMFHQVEGLVIDRGIHLGHLKWTLETFLKAFFERDDIVLRLRPSYFPFTEPSAEVDVGFTLENGQRVLGGSRTRLDGSCSAPAWSTRRVIADCGLDPDEWQGFAFGCGIDRLAMLKYGMDDLRAFFDGDLRWLKHYGFRALDVPTLQRGSRAHEVHARPG